jgi:hypothetical protein
MQNLTDPAVLFFVLGVGAGLLRSNLQIPQPISKFLSLYLLMALGLKGGFSLAQSGFAGDVLLTLALAVLLSVLIPLIAYSLLRRVLPALDAVAVAATYGSVSAVTFVTATQYLDHQGIAYGGHMAAAMALMESPAIILAVLAANHLRQNGLTPLRQVFRESLTDGAQVVLVGAMIIGVLTGDAGREAMRPFSADLFKGMLALFLLDMGLMTAKSLTQFKGHSAWLLCWSLGAPAVHAAMACGLALVAGLGIGDSILLVVLAASASYIAVPAVLRHAIPEANPGIYLGMSLGITFPFNILIGIPLYSTAMPYLQRLFLS